MQVNKYKLWLVSLSIVAATLARDQPLYGLPILVEKSKNKNRLVNSGTFGQNVDSFAR